MSSRRVAKVAEALREQVSTSILFELKDPRVKYVTVTGVEVSPDLRSAKVHVSVMGDEKTQRLTLHGLQSARGFIQAKIAEHLQLRWTPILQFQLDEGVKRSIETSRLLRELLPPSPEASEDVDEDEDDEDDLDEDEDDLDEDEDDLDEDDADEDEDEDEDELPESTLIDEGCAGPVSPAVPIPKSPYERHTENQDG
jgi:ribosome-binding factor A